VELNQEIDRLLMENPALEREDVEESGEAPSAPAASGSSSTAAEAPAADTDWASELSSNWRTGESGDEEGEKTFTQPQPPTLRNHAECAERKLALEVVQKHLELLAARDYTRLKALTGADDEALRSAQRLILGLNPRPGAAFAKIEARYVIPDVVVRKVRNVWRASLNPEAMPRLRINRLYAEIAAGARSAGSLSTQLQEARWLIKNVQQ